MDMDMERVTLAFKVYACLMEKPATRAEVISYVEAKLGHSVSAEDVEECLTVGKTDSYFREVDGKFHLSNSTSQSVARSKPSLNVQDVPDMVLNIIENKARGISIHNIASEIAELYNIEDHLALRDIIHDTIRRSMNNGTVERKGSLYRLPGRTRSFQ